MRQQTVIGQIRTPGLNTEGLSHWWFIVASVAACLLVAIANYILGEVVPKGTPLTMLHFIGKLSFLGAFALIPLAFIILAFISKRRGASGRRIFGHLITYIASLVAVFYIWLFISLSIIL